MGETTTRTDELARLLVLPRLRSQPGVLTAVVASILLATTLLAAGPVLTTAVAEGGLRADLVEAAPSDIGVEVTARTSATRAEDVAASLEAVLRGRFGERVDSPDTVVTAGTIHLAGQPPEVVTPVAVRLGDDGDPSLYDVVEQVAPRADDATPVHLHADAAEALGVAVGDVVEIDGGTLARVGARLEVVGLLAPVDAGDRRWWDEGFGRDGVVPGVDFTEVGPVWVDTPAQLAPLLGTDPPVAVRVRTLPVIDEVTPDVLTTLASRADGLAERVELALQPGDLADSWQVRVPLADAARTATVSLAATRAAVVATVAQVAVLALYTLGLAGRLLRSGREVETMLVRARGATPEQLGRVAAVEGLVLVVPAVLAAPWLATVAVRGIDALGVTAGSSLQLRPVATTASLGAAAAAGVACLAVLVLPALTSARRTYAATRGGRGRRSPIGVVQRMGLDLALVAVAAVGIWQLRSSGGPVGALAPRTAGDIDPVLVAAPALGLLAGALLVLRLVPSLARIGEAVAVRVRGLVVGLGGWQVARRPDAVARPTLLLVLGIAVGVLATTYGATWRASQVDQAAAAVGADLVVEPDRRVTALPDRVVAAALSADPTVDRARPVVTGPVSFIAGDLNGTLVGLDVTDPLLVTREDSRASVPLGELDVDPIDALVLPDGDLVQFDVHMVPDPSWPDLTAELSVVVRDGLGLVHRLADRSVAPGSQRLAWSLADVVGPVHLLALDVTTRAGDTGGEGYAGPAPGAGGLPQPVLDLRVGPPSVGGEQAVPSAPWATDPYTSVAAFPPEHVSTDVGGTGWRLVARTGLAGPRGRLATLRVVHPAGVGEEGPLVPAVVHPDLLEATGLEPGDELTLSASGVPLRFAVTGTVPFVPGQLDEQLPVLVDIDALATARWMTQRFPTRPTA